MKRLLLILLLFISKLAYSQGSTVVYQQNTARFSNKYVFHNDGTFEHYFMKGDGKVWYGKGTFKDKNKSRLLTFGDADLNYQLKYGEVHYEEGFERQLRIIKGDKFRSKDYYATTDKKYVIFQ